MKVDGWCQDLVSLGLRVTYDDDGMVFFQVFLMDEGLGYYPSKIFSEKTTNHLPDHN